MAEQSCRAVLLTCIDFRFFGRVDSLLRSENLAGAADVIAWPGGGAALALEDGDVVLDALALSMRLHRPSEVILVGHEDCGRLKELGDRAPAREPEAFLTSAARAVISRFPHATVRTVVWRLDGSDDWVGFGAS
jgi:carbonic anhydrase